MALLRFNIPLFCFRKIKFAMRVGIFSILTNFLNMLLVSHFKVKDCHGTSIVMTISSLILYGGIKGRKNFINTKKIMSCLFFVLCSFAFSCYTVFVNFLKSFNFFNEFLSDSLSIIAFLTVQGFFVLFLCFGLFIL